MKKIERELRRAFPLAATFSEREIWLLLPRKGRGTECGARHSSDKGAFRITPSKLFDEHHAVV